ncbi:putative nuclease HARBI1 [Spodoptera litura]|uniref:Nuclease HARBI1 n=1 Tax=Spodoptera litura TaxID=69820 RepID=A0A9J7E2Z9_SPOLT|nr:putative nuclease HARBI1 [Spodoptera litura]
MDLFSDESDNEMYEAGVFDSATATISGECTVYSRINYESELSDSEFTFRFRLNKSSVNELLVKILPNLRVKSSRNYGVSPLHQLLLTLRFYALGTMLVSVADFFGVSKATASRIVSDVSRAIAGLYPEYVKVLENTQHAFHAIAGFPKVLGAIDCTHIPIQSPSSNIGEEYRNRKGIFSMNVQGVCNADLLFMNVVARWPGSAHDATIFNNSIIKSEYKHEGVIVADAFPLRTDVLKPYNTRGEFNDKQKIFNYRLSRARRVVENTFGILVSKFRIYEKAIPLSVQKVEQLVKTTCALHNWLRETTVDYVQQRSLETEDWVTGSIVPGEWREVPSLAISDLPPTNARNHSENARRVRDLYAEKFVTSCTVSWQWNMIRRGYNNTTATNNTE